MSELLAEKNNLKDYPDEIESMNKKIEELNKTIKKMNFNKELLIEFYNATGNTETPYSTIKELVDLVLKSIDQNKSNVSDKLNYVYDLMKKFKKGEQKMIIFSDSDGSFYEVGFILDNFNIPYSNLKAGTADKINETVKKYKSNEIDVLFIESSSDGCGINLENTTDILFLHKTGELLYNQMVGRAQRPGRKGVLNIEILKNKNEIV